MKKADKSQFINDLSANLKENRSLYVVNYAGLTMPQARELKSRLREVDAKFVVTKNTLLKLAAKEAGYPEEILTDSVLVGQNAIVIAHGDVIKPLSVIAKFAREFELPQIKVGVVEGSFQTAEQLGALAKLGTKEAIIANLIGMLMAPTYGLVGTLQAKTQELVYVLEAASSKQK